MPVWLLERFATKRFRLSALDGGVHRRFVAASTRSTKNGTFPEQVHDQQRRRPALVAFFPKSAQSFGLRRAVAFDNEHFKGRSALTKRQANKLKWRPLR